MKVKLTETRDDYEEGVVYDTDESLPRSIPPLLAHQLQKEGVAVRVDPPIYVGGGVYEIAGGKRVRGKDNAEAS